MKIEEKKSIGVFFGSRSPEHDISIITGQLILSGLKKLDYQAIPIYIDKQGRWLTHEKLGDLKSFTAQTDFSGFDEYYLDLEKSQGKLVFRRKGFRGKEITVDLAFPALHGANGEDGAIQGLFEMFNVPYVGCDVRSSAVAMDKILTKLFYKAQGILTSEFMYFTATDWQANQSRLTTEITNNLKWPLFVKPPLLGSSIGISKVANVKDLESAIEVALHYGSTVLVEEGVENLMDVTCAVLGFTDPRPSFLQESIYSENLLSYEDKYLNDGGAQTGKSSKSVVIPARLDQNTTKEIQDLSMKIFKLLSCSGIARFDFLYNTETKKYYANEINPLPGTLYHHLWSKSGIELSELLSELIGFAQEKHSEKNKVVTTFASDILKLAGSTKLRLKGNSQ